MKLYGIETCATVRKARAWLADAGVAFDYVDLRKTPPGVALLKRWVDRWGWERVLNRRGTTWRSLTAPEQARVVDAGSAVALMQQRPTLVKRPVIEAEGVALIGFDEAEYAATLAASRGTAGKGGSTSGGPGVRRTRARPAASPRK